MEFLTFSKIKNMKKLLFSALIASSLIACNSETKPPFDLTNAKKEIEAANVNLTDLITKGDSAGAASAYTKDGKFMPANMPAVEGTSNITSFWGGFIKGVGGVVTLTTTEVWGDENYITEEGLFEIKSKEGAQLDKGKYIVLWKKEVGKWKLHRDIATTDLPLATK
jgi:ketosteroid isomerase-like protein